MPGKRGGQRLTMRKISRRAASKHDEDELDEDESTVPDDAKWRTMTPYGLFAISDKDGAKHRFKRDDIATILPQQKMPGEHIEPHEYWVGKILEIRADAGSEDSHVIWAKVRWFYNAEDAAGIVKSLDTSRIGKFERILSPHWDFVLPHTFNEVISMPLLHPYPFLKRNKSGATKFKFSGGHIDTESVSVTTTSTNIEDGDSEPRLEDQAPIGPETFYWRYTIDIVGKKINPKLGLKSCLCSLPYSPDTTSLLKGVMFFCPRPTCRTSFHVGCLRDAKSVWVPDDQEVIVPIPSPSPSKLSGRGRNAGRGRGTGTIRRKSGKGKEKVEEQEAFADVQWFTPRAIRRIACTPDSSDPHDLLSLLSPSPTANASVSSKKHHQQQNPSSTSSSPVVSLLQRVYARQLQHHQHLLQQQQLASSHKHVLSAASSKSKHSSAHSVPSVISTKSGGSWVEVEDLLVTDVDVDMSAQHNTPTANHGGDGFGDEGGANGSGNGNSGGSGYIWDSISQLAPPKSVSKSKPKSGLRSKLQARGKGKSKQVQVELPSTMTAPCKPLQIKPLTPATLLATLFLLPSPFPPSYASATSSQSTTAVATALPSLAINISTAHNAPTTSISTISLAEPTSTSTPDSTGAPDTATDSRDLLLLASQSLLRGAGYIPYLGPTGNVNLVLAARRLILEVLSAVGGLELSSPLTTPNVISTAVTTPGLKKRGRHPKTKSSGVKGKSALALPPTSTKTTDDDDMHGDERELDEAQQDIRDAEDFRKVLDCVHSVIGGWKKKLKEGEKVLPSNAEVDDGIVIKQGLIYDDELLRPALGGGGKANIVIGGERKESGDEDIEMLDGTTWEGGVEMETEGGLLRSGKKRKRVDDSPKDGSRKKGKGKGKEKLENVDEEEEGGATPEQEEMLLRVDWACPGCGSLL